MCYREECPRWSEWSDWGTCSASCSTGVTKRSRNCYAGVCSGPSSEENACDGGPCPTWADWGRWSPCSATCGLGSQSRSRLCQHGLVCPGGGQAAESQACDAGPCPAWEAWSEWSDCSVHLLFLSPPPALGHLLVLPDDLRERLEEAEPALPHGRGPHGGDRVRGPRVGVVGLRGLPLPRLVRLGRVVHLLPDLRTGSHRLRLKD